MASYFYFQTPESIAHPGTYGVADLCELIDIDAYEEPAREVDNNTAFDIP